MYIFFSRISSLRGKEAYEQATAVKEQNGGWEEEGIRPEEQLGLTCYLTIRSTSRKGPSLF